MELYHVYIYATNTHRKSFINICTESQKRFKFPRATDRYNFSRNSSQAYQNQIGFLLPFFFFFCSTLFRLQDPGKIPSKPAYSLWDWFSSDLLLVWSFKYPQSDLFFGFWVESQIELEQASCRSGRTICALGFTPG